MTMDKYVYPGTNILINRLDIRDARVLAEVERGLSNKNMALMQARGVTGRFDIGHIRDIHRTLFRDIYDWAGEFRDIRIYKGGTAFTGPGDILTELTVLCSTVQDRDYFRCVPKDGAANRMADAMARLNLIHPFRDGNGRTQRIFMEQLALDVGYDLDFSGVSEDDMRDASRSANRGDVRLMRYLFRTNMTKL